MKTTTIKIATFILMTVFMSFKTTLWAVEVEPSVTLTTYYSAANGKTSDALRTALQGIISSHTTVSYDNLSYLMVYADTEDADGSTLIDIYSSCPVTISGDRITWSSGTSTVGLGLNREHTVPQSWFSEGAPMKSDAFHVYPVDAKANGNRSDNLYGEFSGSGTQYKSETCSESGKLSASASHSITAYTYQGTTYSPTATYTGKVYEPDDEYKGDIARGYFYMATCYASACSSWSGGAFGSDNNGLANYTAEIMLKWHRQDPVSEKELLRNEVIYGNSTYNKSTYKQGNRNPFIDYPELVEYIWGNKKGQNVSISNLVSGYDGTCSGQLSQPTVTATAGDEQITLTWADVSGADHYTVSIGTGVGYTTECSSPSIGTITHSGTTNTCVITGLINGLAYTTSVVANGVSSICDSDADEDTVTPTAELPTTVTVTFDANGGTGTMSDQVIDYNTATALTENAYTLTGYTFQGWATEQGGTKVYNDGASVTFTESVTLYAVWQINSHNVIFTPSITGATVKVNNSSNSAVSANYGTTVTIAVTPAAHYSLSNVSVSGVGGSVTVSGTGNTRTFTMPDENVTVTITMTEETKYTVNWYVAGTPTEETNYAGEALEGVDDPEIDCNGKVFVGWTTSSSYDSDDAPNDLFTDLTGKVMPNNNTNYYAVFADEVGGGDGENLIEYDGSGKATLVNIVGVTQSGLSSDYSSGTHGEYILKFDSDNDYIQFALSSVPSSLSFNYKMIGGASTSTMTIKESAAADGTYTDVQALTISGSQNSTGTLTTTNAFTQKYVRMVFTKGSNVGVGKITIAGSSTSYSGYTTSCTAPTEVTITFDANGGSGTMADQVIDYNTTTTLNANEFTRTGFVFAGWNTAPDGSGTAYNDEAEVKLPRDITLYAQWKAIYTIRFYDNGTMISEQTVISGEQADKPADREGCGNYAFEGWWTAELANDNTTAQPWVTNFTATQDQDYYAVYSYSETTGDEGVASSVVDVLTRATTGVTDNSYTDWSGKESSSDAVYAGHSAGGNSSIQLRTTNSNSGIVTTKSGGKATNVTVEWNETTTAGRVLNVYGKNTAYDAATDLYNTNTSTQGTLIGTIVYGTSTELTIQDDYAYIGLRSASGAMYLTSISITWSTSSGSTTTYYSTSCNAVSAPADVMLTAQLNGNYYAMTDAFVGSTTEIPAQSYFYESETYYYKGNTPPSNITWRIATYEDSYYITNAEGKYLTIDGENISMGDEPFAWSKNGGGQLVTASGAGLCYSAAQQAFVVSDQDTYASNTDISPSVAEVIVEDVNWEKASLYTRENLNQGYFVTICLPFTVSQDFVEGVNTVYYISNKMTKNGKLTGIVLMPVTGQLMAGTPYVVEMEKSDQTKITLSAWYGEETYTEKVGYATGLVGNLATDKIYVPVGCYGLSNNQLRCVTEANMATIGQYKAYFDLSEVSDGGTIIPTAMGCKVVPTADNQEVPTDADQTYGVPEAINWNEPVYNVLGQRVDRSATGVLIQGATKYIVITPIQ